MFHLLKRYKISNITDDHCQQICRHWLFFLGIKPERTWNFHSIVTLLTLTHSLVVWTYSFINCESGMGTAALHHISLSLLALGLFLLQAFNHKQIINVAKRADNCFSFGSPHLKHSFRRIQKKLFTSWMKMYTDFFIILVFFTWTNIQRTVYVEFLVTSPVKPPPGMILPFENELLHVYMHITETLFIIVACLADVMVAHIFMIISLQITANFRILCHSLESIKSDPLTSKNSNNSKALNLSIRHHQEIIVTFTSLKNLFDKIFYLLYFSMMSAVAMCRTLLTGHIDVGHLIPLFYLETGYIHTFCEFADQIAHASETVRFSAYSADWLNFTKSLCMNIRIIVIRSSKIPRISFYFGGAEISCATFTMIINASLTYFMVSILMERQEN